MMIYVRCLWKCPYCKTEWSTLERTHALASKLISNALITWPSKEAVRAGEFCPGCWKGEKTHLLSSQVIQVPEGILLVDKEQGA